MELEIKGPLEMSESQLSQLEVHSFINVLNVFNGELDHLDSILPEYPRVGDWVMKLATLNKSLGFEEGRDEAIEAIEAITNEAEALIEVLKKQPPDDADPSLGETLLNLTNILVFIRARVDETRCIRHLVQSWELIPPASLRDSVTEFLEAMAHNSKGQYRIVYSSVEQGASDYLAELDFLPGSDGHTAFLPLLVDVTRDLVANARKYTAPGGRISVRIGEVSKQLQVVVSDTGMGIPEGEVEKVVQFGVRGSNMRKRRTLGGGFGLTKAYWIVKRMGGRMWIASKINQGTQVRIEVPLPLWRQQGKHPTEHPFAKQAPARSAVR